MSLRRGTFAAVFAFALLVLLPTIAENAHAMKGRQSAKPTELAAKRTDQAVGCGFSARIGMIDTTVDASHPALKSGRITQRSFLSAPDRLAEHGTAVAALLVGEEGLLPEAELFVAAALEQRRDGSMRLQLKALLQALDWLAANDVKVVNMSFEAEPNGVLGLILERAADNGLVLIAAAGNGGPTALPPYPAAHPRVMAVTAVDQHFRVYRHANRGDYIDFAAPGVDLTTAVRDGWRRQSGTSFAAPYVTATVASLLTAGVVPETSAIRAAIADRAVDLGPAGPDDTYGGGFVRPWRPTYCRSASSQPH